jgi:hypothetical protein
MIIYKKYILKTSSETPIDKKPLMWSPPTLQLSVMSLRNQPRQKFSGKYRKTSQYLRILVLDINANPSSNPKLDPKFQYAANFQISARLLYGKVNLSPLDLKLISLVISTYRTASKSII